MALRTFARSTVALGRAITAGRTQSILLPPSQRPTADAASDDPPTQALVDGFEEQYPNVTIEPQQTDFGNYITSITRSMVSCTW